MMAFGSDKSTDIACGGLSFAFLYGRDDDDDDDDDGMNVFVRG